MFIAQPEIVHTMYVPCTYMFTILNNCKYYVHTCIYISFYVCTCLSMVRICLKNGIYIHFSDMYVHVYARWVGFQMCLLFWLSVEPLKNFT